MNTDSSATHKSAAYPTITIGRGVFNKVELELCLAKANADVLAMLANTGDVEGLDKGSLATSLLGLQDKIDSALDTLKEVSQIQVAASAGARMPENVSSNPMRCDLSDADLFAIRRALLIGLECFGEIERIHNSIGFESIPKNLRPLHPTGAAGTIGVFASALRIIEDAKEEVMEACQEKFPVGSGVPHA